MRAGQKVGGGGGVPISVNNTVSNEYQILNPNQLYPSHTTQGVIKMKPSTINYNKPPVYRQETDCKYGVSSSSLLYIYID